jgi:cyanophycinase-like exopeptidase
MWPPLERKLNTKVAVDVEEERGEVVAGEDAGEDVMADVMVEAGVEGEVAQIPAIILPKNGANYRTKNV